MNKGMFVYFLYQKDFSGKDNDRYFVYEKNLFREVESDYIISHESPIVTHDYWLIACSLYNKHQKLPFKVIDINMLSRIVTGRKAMNGDTQPWDILRTIRPLYKDKKDFDQYMSMYYRRESLDIDIYMLFSHKLAELADQLSIQANERGELERFYDLELPVFNVLNQVACKGLSVSQEILIQHKRNVKNDYYRELKRFSEKHNVLYEVPIEGDIRDKLMSLGYDIENYSIDFLTEFLPSIEGYTEDLKKLQKINKSYRIFNSISSAAKKLTPMVETHSTSTSRIYYKSPNIQNLSRKYRNIFIPDNDLLLSYIDYDQFEVGIMAALSSDKKMLDIYTNTDAYVDLSKTIFDTETYREKCKILFLSYSYGMSIKNILSSVEKQNGNRKAAKEYFSCFDLFENWKKELYDEFEREGRVSTVCGNYLNRIDEGALTPKEKRSVASHVVQGTGSYIFKLTLLELSKQDGVEVLIPMHDALLIQHPKEYDLQIAVNIFKDNMTSVLESKISGKASVENFFTNA